MACHEFEEHLTDYTGWVPPAALNHRWGAACRSFRTMHRFTAERVVRAIGACYTYIGRRNLCQPG